MPLDVLTAGPLLTVQDLGRDRFERFGVPQSGAMDWFAMRVANRLVGNPPGAAVLEFALQAPVLRATEDCLIAAAGRGFIPYIQGRKVGAYRCAFARAGETISFSTAEKTGWGYLAVSGGIEVAVVMSSLSTYLRGGFGGFQGRNLQPGDILAVGRGDLSNWQSLAGRSLPLEYRIPYSDQVVVPVISGPQEDWFDPSELAGFLAAEYSIDAASDRMGYRLTGPPVSRRTAGELLSEGIAPGSIQVPPGGQPIVLLSDRPATGGYAKIATVTRAGLPLLVQAFPGTGRVRFQPVEIEQAQQSYRQLVEKIETGINSDED